MKALFELLKTFPAVQELKNRHAKITSNDNTEEALLIAASFLDKPRKIMVVKNNLYAAQRLYEQLESILKDVKLYFFPVDESFRMEALATSPELLTQRVYVLDQMLNEETYIVITHTAAIVRLLPSTTLFKSGQINLKVGQEIEPNELVSRLIEIGYEQVNRVEHSLQFARRGGVLDVFSVNNNHPIRIEFFDTEIESIRLFNLDTQRTINVIDDARIISATDLIVNLDDYRKQISELEEQVFINEDDIHRKQELEALKERTSYSTLYKYYARINKELGRLFDYLIDGQIIYSHIGEIRDNYRLLRDESFQYLKETRDTSFILHYELESILPLANYQAQIELFNSDDKYTRFPLRSIESEGGNSNRVKKMVEEYLRLRYQIVFCLDNPNQIACLQDWMKDWGYELEVLKKNTLPKSSLTYATYRFKRGFEIPNNHLVFLSAYEIFGIEIRPHSKYTRFQEGIVLESYENLEIGDYVVHETYGIGQFLGIETIVNQDMHRDYLRIAYRGTDVLYLPLDQFKLIRKYVSKQGVAPRLSKLGSKEWEKTKTRIKKRIADISEDLVQLYLKRTKKVGFAFAKDSDYQRQFENSFPYELTDDQHKSVDEIKKDMEATYPMDRLLCGDVGFGKTEVAFIAAFKAILSGKQVAMLCPTTLLARQHYEVAKERFQNFPVAIGVLSRMVSTEDQNGYIKGIKEGTIDLLIGTHRLLSKDIEFKDLGLLIVDEEQRFGVEHKEKIKQLKDDIDVLTLSATPIPRTLQSALFGMRSLSQIETPPQNRMPIQTYVLEKSDYLIKEIIERELSRNGQVFYLHNRVSDITNLANKIQKMVPQASIIVIHGKMNREEIEDSMIAFSEHKANVMICTTIIENGIDIPSANTIIIENADRFGLAQLYQIKGRVGRGDRLAYAYLFYDGKKTLTDVAKKRLQAIKEFAELGSGYRIAMRDLTIRGAGDILGVEQAGFIDSVGMDMYIHLLQEAINERQYGIKEEENERSTTDYKVDAYIPPKFTNDDIDKIDIYKKIGDVKTIASLIDLEKEMVDIYGRLPRSVMLLLEKRRFEIYSKESIVEDIKDLPDFYEIILSEEVSQYDGIGIQLFEMCDKLSKGIIITYRANRIRIRLKKQDPAWLEYANSLLKDLKALIQEYKKES